MKKLYKNKYDNFIIYAEFGLYLDDSKNYNRLCGTVVHNNSNLDGYYEGYESFTWVKHRFEEIDINNLNTEIKLKILKNL